MAVEEVALAGTFAQFAIALGDEKRVKKNKIKTKGCPDSMGI